MSLKKLNARDLARANAAAAMPDVRALLKKHGRRAVSACLGKIAVFEKEKRKLDALKKEVSALEKRVTRG